MGYNNKPKMPKGNYSANNSKNTRTQFNNNNKSYRNNNFLKDEEDIYSPKIYAKKPKAKSSFDDIIIPEYEMEKQRMRNKRENDKKYKNKYR